LSKSSFNAQDAKGLIKLTEHLVRVEGASQHGRTYIAPDALKFLVGLAAKVEDLQGWKLDQLELFAKGISDVLKEKAEDFPFAYMKAVDFLASVYQVQNEFKKAAVVLSGFKFDNYRQLNLSAAEKVNWLVNTAEFWLSVDDSGNASQHVKRAYQFVSEVKSDPKLVFKIQDLLRESTRLGTQVPRCFHALHRIGANGCIAGVRKRFDTDVGIWDHLRNLSPTIVVPFTSLGHAYER